MIRAREQLHQIVDELSDDQLAVAARYLQQLCAAESRPTLADVLTNAPYDDESLTDEDIAGIDEGQADVVAGRIYSTDEIRRRLDLPPIENP